VLAVWVRVTLGLLALTLLARDRALTLWLGTLGAAWALGGLLLGRVLDTLAVRQAVSSSEAFAGETVTVHLRLVNRSAFPLPWVRMGQVLPRRLDRHPPGWLASLPPGAAFQVSYRLRLPHRGLYRIGCVELEAGDWFGLWRRRGYVDLPLWLTVYPRPLEAGLLPPPPRLPEGQRPLPTSPFRAWEPAGLREYRRGDPPRWIAWKATAHRGTLVVRELPPVRERAHVVVLDLRPGRWPAAHRQVWIERAVALAAAWVLRAAERDEPVGLFTYGSLAHQEPDEAGATGQVRPPLPAGPAAVALPARRGARHRRELLRLLACLEPAEDPSFARSTLAALRRLAPGASVLWIAGRADEEAVRAAAAAVRAGHAVALAVAGEGGGRPGTSRPGSAAGPPAVAAPGVTVWPLPFGEDEACMT
jgi:uncharacterized protein (DUF58 family)